MRTLIIIPAFNSSETLPKLIDICKKYIPDILVVDDGSHDNTSYLAQNAGAAVTRHGHNMGKGAALKTGFACALEKKYDCALAIDSDGQHNPTYIPAFLETYNRTNADIVIGSRIGDKADMPLGRRFSNWTTSHIISWLLKAKIEDLQCGYRLYSRKLIESIDLESDKFELETEVVIKAIKEGYKVAFVPIRVEYGQLFPTNINSFADTLRWCRCVLKYI
jgi:glycosyltransferase involved in cell wall biosynthesis